MKHILSIILLALSCSACGVMGQINWDSPQMQQAAAAALTAASINDSQIALLSKEAVAQMDAQNKLADDRYQQRLSRLMYGINEVEGLKINYKVYQTNEVNAFACGDGSIRVYSALMDIMDDDELMAIIGHECGHVVHKDTKKAMKNAYLAYAARYALGSTGGTIGALSMSALGDIGQAFVSSQYSQKQEFAADDYGYKFSTEHGYSPYSMAKALDKLVQLAGGKQASSVQKMFASHPDSAERAQRMRQKADAAAASKQKP